VGGTRSPGYGLSPAGVKTAGTGRPVWLNRDHADCCSVRYKQGRIDRDASTGTVPDIPKRGHGLGLSSEGAASRRGHGSYIITHHKLRIRGGLPRRQDACRRQAGGRGTARSSSFDNWTSSAKATTSRADIRHGLHLRQRHQARRLRLVGTGNCDRHHS
jgi:hypothetical protein